MDFEALGDTLGAFCRHTHVALDGAPDGPLAGLSFAAKDLYDIAGHKTGCGNPDWLATHDAATTTASTVSALLAAGARLVGKTQTDELAFSLNGENHFYGTPANPNAPGRIPGGSSSGSAAAVAGGLVDVALGTDTGGSVRGPASYCGVWGLRTTHGAISLDGIMPLAPSFDTVGWFAREAGLMARVGDVLLPPGPSAPPTRLLLVEDAFEEAYEAARGPLRAAAERAAAALGATLEPIRLSETDAGLAEWHPHFSTLQWREIWETHGAWITAVEPSFGPGIAERFDGAAKVTDAAVAEARPFRERVAARLAGMLTPGTALVEPTVPGAAPEIGLPQDRVVDYRNRALRILCIAGLARLPQLSMPIAQTADGLPLGLSLVGGRGTDLGLLAAGEAIGRA
ncbi:MAG: amidase [Alphaproteobacteria bacterium]|jgi:amidase|nr:amidase [Alphaproteobacteria bacterium]